MRRRTTAHARQTRPHAPVIEPLEGRRLLATIPMQGVQPPPPIITAYPLPGTNIVASSITTGPDGNLWFLEASSATSKVGRITTDGVLKEFPIPDGFYYAPSHRLTTGPDGALWFTGIRNAIGRITTDGAVSVFPLPNHDGNGGAITGGTASDIAVGPDGNLWFTEGDANLIGRITPTGVVSEFAIPSSAKVGVPGIPENPPTYITSSEPTGIAAGSDGNLWFTESATNKIGRITPTGVISEYALPGMGRQPGEIASGPDGNLYFTVSDNSGGASASASLGLIGKITPAGVVSVFTPPSKPRSISSVAAGPDGNVYFTEDYDPGSQPISGSSIGWITPGGEILGVPVVSPQDLPRSLTGGPDGNIWFTQLLNPTISRLRLPAAPPPVVAPVAPAPVASPFSTSTTPGFHLAAGPFAPFVQAWGRLTSSHASAPVAREYPHVRHVALHQPRLHGRPHPRPSGGTGLGRSGHGGARVRLAHHRG